MAPFPFVLCCVVDKLERIFPAYWRHEEIHNPVRWDCPYGQSTPFGNSLDSESTGDERQKPESQSICVIPVRQSGSVHPGSLDTLIDDLDRDLQ